MKSSMWAGVGHRLLLASGWLVGLRRGVVGKRSKAWEHENLIQGSPECDISPSLGKFRPSLLAVQGVRTS